MRSRRMSPAHSFYRNRRGTEPYARWCGRTAGAIPPPTRCFAVREHPSPGVRTTRSIWESGRLQVPQHHCRRITRTGMRPESLAETIPKSTKADDRKPSSNLWAKIESRQTPALLHRQQHWSALTESRVAIVKQQFSLWLLVECYESYPCHFWRQQSIKIDIAAHFRFESG